VLSAGTGTGTIALGDSVDGDQYVTAVAPTSAGQQAVLAAPYAYSSADSIRATIATAAVNAKVRVWATMVSLDKGGSDADTDAQNVTFS
jgi:predicted RNA methylase